MAGLSQHDQAMMRAVAKTIRDQNDKLFGAVDARLKQLEQRNLADSYRGTYDPDATYRRGETLTHDGGLWLCVHESSDRPGKSADWRLIVKGAAR